VFVVQYTDAGATARGVWAAAGGGAFDERGYAVARNAAGVYVAGQVGVPATFGSFALPGVNSQMGLLARLGGGVLPTRDISSFPEFTLFPNPGTGRATINGLPAGQSVQVFDALGRWVFTGVMPTTGVLFVELAPTRPAGAYLVKANGQVRRWLVE
jgi:hypothetical protein